MTAASTRTAARSRPLTVRRATSPAAVLARRAFLDARTRTVVFAYIYGVYAWLQAAGYHSTYPSLADRRAFAATFAGNDAIRLFYGYPYDVLTVGGYCAWRVGGTLSLAGAAFGVLAAVRALRAEEEAGRTEMVLAGTVGRRTLFASSMAAIAAGAAILWLAEFAGFIIAGLPATGSAYLAIGTASVVPVFVGIGALASQFAPTRRVALSLGAGAAALFWLLRVVSDTMPGAAWVRWTTPLGWAEGLRPFAGPRPLLLLLPVAAATALLLASARIAASRDVGGALLPATGTARPSTRLLSGPTAQALRRQLGVFGVWGVGFAGFGVVLGMISTSVSRAGISSNMQEDFKRFGAGSITSPTGYLSLVFIVFVFAAGLFACAQVASAREEEAEQRLETLLALPVSRHRWLGGRLVVAGAAAGVLSLLAGFSTWAGAASQGVDVPLSRLLEAGANCVPVAWMFLGVSALVYSLFPRASTAISYTAVSVAFLWNLVGALVGAPPWLIDVTPFRHIGLVPFQDFRVFPALVMVAVGVATATLSLAAFRRRDLLGA